MKFCNDCQTYKHESEFSKNIRKPDGLDIYCKPCIRKRSKEHYEKNKAKRNAQSKEWFKNNPDKAREIQRRHKEMNPGKIAEYQHNWYIRNKETKAAYYKNRRENNISFYLEKERLNSIKNKESRSRKEKRWRALNKHKVAAYASKRRAAITQRTPPWLNQDHLAFIDAYYLSANILTKETGVKHHVDHIVPLCGKTVSGLHVPWNLQVIPATENLKKNNHLTDQLGAIYVQ